MTCPLCKHENAPDADRCANCLIRFAPKAKSELDEALDALEALLIARNGIPCISEETDTARAILAKHGRMK